MVSVSLDRLRKRGRRIMTYVDLAGLLVNTTTSLIAVNLMHFTILMRMQF